MKIYAFEVRDDETEYFNEMAKKYNVEIKCSADRLSVANIPFLEPGSAVTILGQSHIGEEEASLLEAQKIIYLTTRSIGYNHIDLEAAKRHHIHVSNSAYAPNGVADYTIMMILLCLRKYKQALWRTQCNDYSLDGLQGRELKDLTVGILGTGRIGAAVAKDLTGFGCRMIAYDLHENPSLKGIVEYMSLDEVYAQADIITLHMPLFDSTYHMINDDSIAKMKKGVVIVNCARGALTDVHALTRGIESEQIGALGIDVLENEEDIVHKNLKTDIFSNRDMAYLRQFKNVVHTQHMAFYTDAAVKSMVEYGVSGIISMAEGKQNPLQLC